MADASRSTRMTGAAKTLLDKIWERHLVEAEAEEHPAILYIDLHLIHEVTSPQAFTRLAARGLKVRRPDRTLATIDHSIPTTRPACRRVVSRYRSGCGSANRRAYAEL